MVWRCFLGMMHQGNGGSLESEMKATIWGSVLGLGAWGFGFRGLGFMGLATC